MASGGPVVVAANQGEVVEVGGATVGPRCDVMPLAVLGWLVTAREAAALVSGDQGEGLGAGGNALCTAVIETAPCWSRSSRCRLASSAIRSASSTRQQLTEGSLGQPLPGAELVSGESDDHLGGCSGFGQLICGGRL